MKTYFDPSNPIGFVKGGNLPHWRQDGSTYFVTWRAADSLPQARVQQWIQERKDWLASHPEPHDLKMMAEYDRLFPARWEQWLDEGHGECLLSQAQYKTLVEDTIRHFDKQQYRLDEFIVMPNHVHVLTTPFANHTLSKIVQAWKSVSSHAINKVLHRRTPFWQKESFDHIVRNADQMTRFRQYIRDNPGQ